MNPRGHDPADVVARTLVRAGVKRVFTLSGNHVMSIFDAAPAAGLDLVHVRHEAAAVHMADAWARLTGEVGVALATGGPGSRERGAGALHRARLGVAGRAAERAFAARRDGARRVPGDAPGRSRGAACQGVVGGDVGVGARARPRARDADRRERPAGAGAPELAVRRAGCRGGRPRATRRERVHRAACGARAGGGGSGARRARPRRAPDHPRRAGARPRAGPRGGATVRSRHARSAGRHGEPARAERARRSARSRRCCPRRT